MKTDRNCFLSVYFFPPSCSSRRVGEKTRGGYRLYTSLRSQQCSVYEVLFFVFLNLTGGVYKCSFGQTESEQGPGRIDAGDGLRLGQIFLKAFQGTVEMKRLWRNLSDTFRRTSPISCAHQKDTTWTKEVRSFSLPESTSGNRTQDSVPSASEATLTSTLFGVLP